MEESKKASSSPRDTLVEDKEVNGVAELDHRVSPSKDRKVHDPYLVTFEPHDAENPRNWSKAKKWYLTIFCSYLNVLVASQASAYSTGQEQLEKEFNMSSEAATVGLSLYVLGFALFPMVVAPLSEAFGRRIIYVVCWVSC